MIWLARTYSTQTYRNIDYVCKAPVFWNPQGSRNCGRPKTCWGRLVDADLKDSYANQNSLSQLEKSGTTSKLLFWPYAQPVLKEIIYISKTKKCVVNLTAEYPIKKNQYFEIRNPKNHKEKIFKNKLFLLFKTDISTDYN